MASKNLGIVALNETEFLSPELKTLLGDEYYTVYVYDKDEQTRLCEITPSFYLIPFDYAGKNRLSDEDDSEYREDLMGEPIYVHCRTIESMDDKFKTTAEVEWDEEEDFESQARELMSANPSHPDYILKL